LKKALYIFYCIILLQACKSKETATVTSIQESKPAPIWVSERPNNGFKFVGIGFADKKPGNNYQQEAKKNALYDLASEIKVNISSNSVLYTVQNNNNFNENFNSLIKLSNSDNIEGYTLIDSYENEKQYWVYYSLDKQEYNDLKAKKKQQIILKASNLIAASYADEKNSDFSSSLKKRIQAFSVLTPYLSEEINFNETSANGIKNVFDLTSLIQTQLQSISVASTNVTFDLKPYQARYNALNYKLLINNKSPLQNFPLTIFSDDEHVKIIEKGITNANGELQLKVREVEPINQFVSFSINPDIATLIGNDSISVASINILKQFVQTNFLKLQAKVSNITVYIQSVENNFGKTTNLNTIANMIQQKFNGNEIHLVNKPELADFIIESVADTQEDASSDVLDKNYNLKLAALIINLQLKNKLNNNETFKTQVKDVFGYANSLEKAGLNAYDNPKLQTNLMEALFFLKRKMLVY